MDASSHVCRDAKRQPLANTIESTTSKSLGSNLKQDAPVACCEPEPRGMHRSSLLLSCPPLLLPCALFVLSCCDQHSINHSANDFGNV